MASYDPDSGQVFREWTISRQTLAPSHHRDWSRARPTSTKLARGANGPRTLVDMAAGVVAMNVGSLNEDHVDVMAPSTRLRVWQFLEARGVNLHAWKLFPKYFLQGKDNSAYEPTLSLYRYRQHICRANHPLHVYIGPLSSINCDFITHLVISGGCGFSTSEMVTLADMPNLGALEIIQPQDDRSVIFPEITDRLVRGWLGRPKPFPLLRVLRIWGDRTTTTDSLQDLARLPSLALYDVTGSREDWRQAETHAKASGWTLADTTPKMTDRWDLVPYLKLLVPQMPPQRYWQPPQVVETDLKAVCNDSKTELVLVPHGTGSTLFDYLTDGGIVNPLYRGTRPQDRDNCSDFAFEAWAFWLYTFIGEVTCDWDLDVDTSAMAAFWPLPSKRMACLFLGHSTSSGIAQKPSYVRRGMFATRKLTFTRRTGPVKKEPRDKAEPKEQDEKKVNPRKRQRVDDILRSFTANV